MRRLKKPNLEFLPGLGAATGSVAECGTSRSDCISGVGSRAGARAVGAVNDDGLGDGILVEILGGTMLLDLVAIDNPFLDSVELVRRCPVGKLLMLL